MIKNYKKLNMTSYLIKAYFYLIIIVCFTFTVVTLIKWVRKAGQVNLGNASYQEGYQEGYSKGLGELETYKHSAIKYGVAKYEIVDELTGDTQFVWVTSSNTIPLSTE
jgi:hypothetical protein